MITLTIKNLKTKKKKIECFSSKDKAEQRLANLITDSKRQYAPKGEYLESWSYDSKGEKDLIDTYLPEDRITKG